ncbi:Hsp20/alpha crystallin family protein [Magnetovibrio sp. PR-2]|uniref:Hsp20/alpha crystallin family protein n=1 Tax=Magnetovibrio sp. PR-2 TaxID=3120356 RepID=UPI002FCE5311
MSVKVKKTKDASPPETPEGKTPAASERLMQHPLLTLREEVDHLFDNFFSGFALGPFSHGRDKTHAPAFRRFENAFAGLSTPFEGLTMKADVREAEGEYRVEAEIPGLDEKDIEVTAQDGLLTISGHKKEETKTDEDDYHLTERHYGSVERSFPIPEGVELGKATAKYKNGVVTVTMPKKVLNKPKSKKIPISAD